MFRKLGEVPFEEWVDRVFDQPISQPQWYFQNLPENAEVESWDHGQDPGVIAAYLTRLFSEAGERLAAYSPLHIQQGLWYLASDAGSSYIHALFEESSEEERLRCVESFYDLYAGLFAPQCAAVLAHCTPPPQDALRVEERRLIGQMQELFQKHFPEVLAGEVPENLPWERFERYHRECEPLEERRQEILAAGTQWDPYPLNDICYMWWDILSIYGAPEDPARAAFDRAVVDVMERTLGLDSIACQEGALHGLGHWKHHYPERIEGIIDAYIERVRPQGDLLEYAQVARTGYIL